MKGKTEAAPQCTHPIEKVYAWYADEFRITKRKGPDYPGKMLCMACTVCGKILRGGAQLGKESPPYGEKK